MDTNGEGLFALRVASPAFGSMVEDRYLGCVESDFTFRERLGLSIFELAAE